MPKPSVGSLIQSRLHAADLTQQELADRMRVSRLTVHKLANNLQRVTPNTAARLARHLGETTRYWLERQVEADVQMAKQKGRI